MKVIFSRKGFDSSSGGGPSPIIGGRPVSLPIPTGNYPSLTTYGEIGVEDSNRNLGDLVEEATRRRKNRYTAESLCHHDPMFEGDYCAFGQVNGSQTHLHDNGVCEGSIFLFFGLFNYPGQGDAHHRIYGYMEVENIKLLGPNPTEDDQPCGFSMPHPHTLTEGGYAWKENNTLYLGKGCTARTDDKELRLTIPSRNTTCWRVPVWLREVGLTHFKESDWEAPDILKSVDKSGKPIGRRGQEFVADIKDRSDAKEWVEMIIAKIRNGR